MTEMLEIASKDKSLLVLFFRKELLPYAFVFADLLWKLSVSSCGSFVGLSISNGIVTCTAGIIAADSYGITSVAKQTDT
jgi:hypothetical protein